MLSKLNRFTSRSATAMKLALRAWRLCQMHCPSVPFRASLWLDDVAHRCTASAAYPVLDCAAAFAGDPVVRHVISILHLTTAGQARSRYFTGTPEDEPVYTREMPRSPVRRTLSEIYTFHRFPVRMASVSRLNLPCSRPEQAKRLLQKFRCCRRNPENTKRPTSSHAPTMRKA